MPDAIPTVYTDGCVLHAITRPRALLARRLAASIGAHNEKGSLESSEGGMKAKKEKRGDECSADTDGSGLCSNDDDDDDGDDDDDDDAEEEEAGVHGSSRRLPMVAGW